jgi:hypothetical protein
MKLSKISLAVAAVAAIAGGAAYAGQIGSSSVTLATEVIKTNAQQVRAPSTVYSFAGDIDARTNAQTLQLQYTLSEGRWATGAVGTAFFTGAGASINAANLLVASYLDGGNAANTVANAAANSFLPAGSLINGFLTADFKTLVINITIPATAGNTGLIKSPSFTINGGAFPAANAGIQGLADVAGVAACVAPDKAITIGFKHFATHNGQTNTDVISGANLAAEHLRVGSTNSAEYVRFVQNHNFTFNAASVVSRTDAATLNQSLVLTVPTAAPTTPNWPANVADGAGNAGYAQPVLADLGAGFVINRTHYLGQLTLNQRAQGRDLNLAAIYGAGGTPADTLVAGDFSLVANASNAIGTGDIGVVEVSATTPVTAKFTFPAALPTGSVVQLFSSNGGPAIATSAATVAGQTVVDVNVTTAANAAIVANGPDATSQKGAFAYVKFPANLEIPQLSAVTVATTLVKAPANAAAPDLSEQSVSCTGSHTGIGGGIKIDLRNYASFASFGATGPASSVRLINNSESKTADIFAQMIYADGTYGPYGLVGSLKPREVLNISNKDLEAKMTTAAPAANPFGASTVYTSVSGAAVVAGPKAGVGDRVRFVSNSGTTLRVQSFIALGSTILNVSDAQGVDFENNLNNRAPTNDGQPISQDAINGLAR